MLGFDAAHTAQGVQSVELESRAMPDPLQHESKPTRGPGRPKIGPFQDVPAWIWTIFIGAWAVLFALFCVFFTTGAEAAFAVTIASLFALMAFGLPLTLAALGKAGRRQRNSIVDTRSGPLTVEAAAVQIVTIPIAAVVGLVAFIVLAM